MKSKTNLLAWALTLVLICLPLAAFTSCGDDDDDPISTENVVGTWVTTSVESSTGEMVDLTKPIYSSMRAYATFYSNGTYRGWGALGYGSGTWKLSGNTVTTYIDNKVYITYKNLVVKGNEMSGTMVQKSTSMKFKAKKQ